MVSLRTSYMGLDLKSPLIVGSCGLTRTLSNLQEYEQQGAGAVVIKSLFQEEIELASQQQAEEFSMDGYPEAYEYISQYTQGHCVDNYLDFVRDCKRTLEIPILCSINCVTPGKFLDYVRDMEKAGADALELNIFILPTDKEKSSAQLEKNYFDILAQAKKQVTIPVSLKLSSYFSSFAQTMAKLSWSGMDGLVIFNRFFSSDINTDTLELKSAPALSTPQEIYHTLRWVRHLSPVVDCDIAASTGVHDTKGFIKMLLAGAKAVEMVSAIYKQGGSVISQTLEELTAWMKEHKFETPNDFIGMLQYKDKVNAAGDNRIQFMKKFAGLE